ncbi:radical SAM protein [Pyrolobus fumarii]|uniref:radical SAM protein n=1 Tax=Pyrolobus fumarii TaxID=54252 RepID=UPI00244DB090|nr:radical SAM protein [Pyrolobus fumarii]
MFHYWPNSTSLTFSGWGCNFLCPWCQNYLLSWVRVCVDGPVVPPERLVEWARRAGDEGLCASFNEPVTLFDYLLDLAEVARREGFYLSLVTNAYFTTRAVDALVGAGWDGWSVDIKGCPEASRRRRDVLPGVDHEVVFRNARRVLDNGGHVEMIYLVVPGYNDVCAEWIIERHLDYLGPDVPLHVNRYYPAFRWGEPPTPVETLLRIAEKARRAGIKYVYVGNVHDPELEATRCPRCGKVLVVREGYRVTHWGLVEEGGRYRCPRCGEIIPIRGKYVGPKPTRYITFI